MASSTADPATLHPVIVLVTGERAGLHHPRPTVCRRPGCAGHAADETLRLCPAHLASYEALTIPALALLRARKVPQGHVAS